MNNKYRIVLTSYLPNNSSITSPIMDKPAVHSNKNECKEKWNPSEASRGDDYILV